MYTLSKLSLIASIIIVIAFVAERLGILEMRYAAIIAIIAAVIQAILLVVVIVAMVIKHRKVRGIPMTRYQFNDRLIKGNDYILPRHVSTTNPRKSAIFKILLEIKDVDESPEIGISKTNVSMVTQDIKDHIINVNSCISGNSFIFDADIIVKPDESINFQLKKDTVIKSFFLGEFYIP